MDQASQNKILKYIILAVIGISVLVLLKETVWKTKELEIPEISLELRQIKVDYELLQNPDIEALLPFEKISLPKEIGRENPFEPY